MNDTPVTSSDAALIAAICLFSTGHWIGGLSCLGLIVLPLINGLRS